MLITRTGCACLLGVLMFMAASSPARADITQLSSFPADLMELEDAVDVFQAGDLPLARRAFQQLAELGFPGARFNLGLMLLRGDGGESDHDLGLAWVTWAAQQGLPSAISVMDSLLPGWSTELPEELMARLSQLQQEHDLHAALAGERGGVICEGASMHRVTPRYPAGAAQTGSMAYVEAQLSLNRYGEVDGVHFQPTLPEREDIKLAALRALVQWRLNDCQEQRERVMHQHINFMIEGRQWQEMRATEFSAEARRWVLNLMKLADSGDPGASYHAYQLSRTYTRLLNADAEKQRNWLIDAALLGHPQARYHLALSLSGEQALRWNWLAAAVGEPSALYSVAIRSDTPLSERHYLLGLAASEGHHPAIARLADELSVAADPALRDPERALALTSSVPESELKRQAGLMRAHAAALAGNADWEQAVSWQQKLLAELQALKRNTAQAEERLSAYREQRAWYQPGSEG